MWKCLVPSYQALFMSAIVFMALSYVYTDGQFYLYGFIAYCSSGVVGAIKNNDPLQKEEMKSHDSTLHMST